MFDVIRDGLVAYSLYSSGKFFASSEILDGVIASIITVCLGNGSMMGFAYSLYGKLIALDFIIGIIMNLIKFNGGSSFIAFTITKMFKYGFWVWIISNWRDIVFTVMDSFTKAGSSFGLGAEALIKPSKLINMGFIYAMPYFEYLWDLKFDTQKLILCCFAIFAAIGVVTAFVFIALNIFVTVVEFYIVTTLLWLLIPFSVNEKTEKFSSNCYNFIFGCGVKLLFSGAILGMTVDALNASKSLFDITKEPTAAGLITVVICWAFAYLACEVPALAGAMLSGNPALSSHNLIAHTLGAGAVMYQGASMIASAAATTGEDITRAAGAFSSGGFTGLMKAGTPQNVSTKIGDTFAEGKAMGEQGFGDYHKPHFSNYHQTNRGSMMPKGKKK